MLIEECYRAALVALRDGQWEEAATHLLTIAIDNPTYRDVDRVLEVLQRTRSVSYWCAAFTIAQEQAAYEPARAALEQIVALAPALPRLESLRQALAAIAPPEAQAASPLEDAGEDQGIAPVSPPAPAAEPDDPPAAVYTSAAGDSEPLRSLDLDPLTELLFDDKWVELLGNRGTKKQAEEVSAKKACSPDVVQITAPGSQYPADTDAQLSSAEHPADVYPADAYPAAAPSPAELQPENPSLVAAEIEPVPLPEEPEGDFVRLNPLAPETEDPTMAAEPHLPQEVEPASPGELQTQHHYSMLQLLGLLSFPLILVTVAVYVLFGQGNATLIDMLREAQAGTAINTTLDLIAAIDTQLALPDETERIQAQLDDYASLAAVLAEETPELEAALHDWIEAGRAMAAARTHAAGVCTDADSPACDDARQSVDALAAAVEEQRAFVCALTLCPETPPDSVNG